MPRPSRGESAAPVRNPARFDQAHGVSLYDHAEDLLQSQEIALARKSTRSLDAARRNQSGQAMGAKGLQTRRRLIEATGDLLRTKPLRELTVSDITRVANTSASTFYLYFTDVPEAVLGAIRGVSQSTPELLELLDKPWPPETVRQQAESFVHSYVETWRAHSHLFRVRNMTADEGDERFETARRLSISPLLETLALRIADGLRASGRQGLVEPRAAAGALIAMIERLASIRARSFDDPNLSNQSVINAAAFFVTCVLGPGLDPGAAAGMEADG